MTNEHPSPLREGRCRRFVGRTVVITGASGGIGRATALRFADEGAELFLAASESEQLADVVEECRSMGAHTDGIVGDLADAEEATRLIQACIASHGSIDVLVNNAFWEQVGSIVEVDLEGWERTIRVSLTSYMLLTKLALPTMVSAGSGAIVNVISQRAFASGHGAVAYESAKAAILGLSRSVAVDYGKFGVRTNCVSPGMVLSERVRSWYEEESSRQVAMSEVIPLGRPGCPEEIASVIAFVASPEASYMNGAVISVDGGALAGLPENAALLLAQRLAHP